MRITPAFTLLVLIASSVATADVVPVSRTTSLTASWFQADPPFPGSGGSNSDGTTSLDYYSNTITSGSGSSSQTSYLVTGGAYASASGIGFRNTSVMHPAGASGRSTFTYIFDLTSPATLYITGSLNRGSPFVGYGSIELYDDATNTRVYQAAGAAGFEVNTPIADVYAAAAGRYRFVVSGGNDGAGGGAPNGSSSAQAYLTLPGPGAACPLALGALLTLRRRRA